MEAYTDLNGVYDKIESYLNDNSFAKISVIFASNTSGKTRLSKLFCDHDENNSVLCYNAFLEDCFSWDNERYTFNICDCWAKELIEDEGLDKQIIDHFQKFANAAIEPRFNLKKGEVTFRLIGDDEYKGNIKISKGEESLFIWSVFYTILQTALENLVEPVDNRTTEYFNSLKYIIIDDPVSSMDDSRIISVALAVVELLDNIVKAQDKFDKKLGVLITTHHALFFSVIHNKNIKAEKRKQQDYVLSKKGKSYLLEEQNSSSPFAYHHEMLREIQRAIEDDVIRKYHFNLFRCLLEKTANFLGYKGNWSTLIEDTENKDLLTKLLNHYSHNQLSETESRLIEGDDKEQFKDTFKAFLKTYKWNYPVEE